MSKKSRELKRELNRESHYLLIAIKFGLFAALFMPLVVIKSFVFPYIFPKQILFQVIVEIVFSLYIILAIRDSKYRPKSDSLLLVLLAYFIILIISSILGENAYHSFWSSYERMAGVISVLHYFAFLIVAAFVFKKDDDWHRFFEISIIVSVLVSCTALYQLLEFLMMTKNPVDGVLTEIRISGTTGNPIFTAGYLMINIFFACWLFLEKKGFGRRALYFLSIMINIIVIYKSQTRGAVLALFVGLIAISIFFLFIPEKDLQELSLPRTKWIKKMAASFLILLIIVLGSVWAMRKTDFIKNQPIISRLSNISLSDTTASIRLMVWEMSLKGFLKHPIFGWGPENASIPLNKYFNPKIFPNESWFDRSHNVFLDTLVHTGAAGFIAYMSIFLLAFRNLWKGWRGGKIKYHTGMMFSVILLSYLVQNLLVFDTQVTFLMIFSILAFLIYLGIGNSTDVEIVKNKNTNAIKYVYTVSIIVIFILGTYFINIRPGYVNWRCINALMTFQGNNFARGISEFKEVFALGTFGLVENAGRANASLVNMLNSPAVQLNNKKIIAELLDEGIRKALVMEPQNVRLIIDQSNIYKFASTWNPRFLVQAEAILLKARELAPTHPILYFLLGEMMMQQGRKQEVLSFMKKAMELNESADISHWNYGLAAIHMGEKVLGEYEIKRSGMIEKRHPVTGRELTVEEKIKAYMQLIQAYSHMNDWPSVISLYEEMIRDKPGTLDFYGGLAAAYAKTGDKKKASDTAMKAILINPSARPQVEAFIKSLGL